MSNGIDPVTLRLYSMTSDELREVRKDRWARIRGLTPPLVLAVLIVCGLMAAVLAALLASLSLAFYLFTRLGEELAFVLSSLVAIVFTLFVVQSGVSEWVERPYRRARSLHDTIRTHRRTVSQVGTLLRAKSGKHRHPSGLPAERVATAETSPPPFVVISGDDFERFLLTSLDGAAEWEVEITVDDRPTRVAEPITDGFLGPYKQLRPGECAWGVSSDFLRKGRNEVTIRDEQGRLLHRLIVQGHSVTHLKL